jgi:hypothetical protein
MAGTGFPAMKAVCRSEKQAFRQEKILVPFHMKFDIPAKNIKDLVVRMGVDLKIEAGALIAFIMPYLHKAAMKNMILMQHTDTIPQESDFCNVFDDFNNGFYEKRRGIINTCLIRGKNFLPRSAGE